MSPLALEIGREVARLSPGAHFVGGCVRDALLGLPVKDLDFVLTGDPRKAGQALLRRYPGHLFWLREDEGVARILLPGHDALQLDLCRMRGALHEDLLARDLTINAIAFPAGAGEGWASALVDPAGGREDLAQRQIRFVRPDAPERDPLRVLRALRLAWKLGFTLPPDTEAIARTCVPKLDRVSGERIRDEWFQLLALPSPTPAVGQAMDWGLGPWTLGCGAGANVGRVAGALGALLSQPELQTPEVSEWLDRSVTAGRSRRQLLAHAAALLAVEPPVAAEESARRLALSSDEKQILARGAAARDTAAALLAAWPVPGRHRLRFRLAAGGAAPEAVLLTPRDQGCGARATLLQETLTCSLNPPEPLITGGALIRALGLAPGPRVGRLLREIEEARADGLLTTGDQAVAWARERVAGDTPSSGRS